MNLRPLWTVQIHKREQKEITKSHRPRLPPFYPVMMTAFYRLPSLSTSERNHIKTRKGLMKIFFKKNPKQRQWWRLYIVTLEIKMSFADFAQKDATLILKFKNLRALHQGNLYSKSQKTIFPVHNIDTSACVRFSRWALICIISMVCSVHSHTPY